MNFITIDAKGMPVGRVASRVADILNGKTDIDFMPNKVTLKKVKVINVGKMILSGNKLNQKLYYSHSGYHGALKKIAVKDIFKKDPRELFLKVINGMISSNRLKDDKLKKLILEV